MNILHIDCSPRPESHSRQLSAAIVKRDQILRAGRTFKSTHSGKVGMLRDRPVLIGIASGGVFAGDRASQPDFLTPYLSVVLGSIGLNAVQFVSVQATAFLEGNQATLARDRALAAIDFTAIGGVPVR